VLGEEETGRVERSEEMVVSGDSLSDSLADELRERTVA
jgi:hypothetical protein